MYIDNTLCTNSTMTRAQDFDRTKTIDKLTTVVLVSGMRVLILRIMRRSAPADKYTSYTRHRKYGNFLTYINSANVHLKLIVLVCQLILDMMGLLIICKNNN